MGLDMKPTPKLRFVERDFITGFTGRGATVQVTRILQQWWEHTEWDAEGEWRDVPIEKEQS
jgi:hypothetical protein